MFEGPVSMDSHKEVSHKDAMAPETIHPYQEGLETAAQPYYQQSTHRSAYEHSQVSPASTTIKSDERKPKHTIFGLRRRNFVILIVIILVIIAASVGGAVGSISARKDNSGCAAATTTVDTAGTSSTSGLTVPTGVVALDCPSLTNENQVITLAESSWTFTPACSTNYYGADIASVISYSFRDCLQGCAAMNYYTGNTTCAAVVFAANQTFQIPQNYGNCWFKTGTGRVDTGLGDGIVSAALTSTST